MKSKVCCIRSMAEADMTIAAGACPGVNIMQVVHVDGRAALATAKAAAEHSDMVLLDSGCLQGPVKQLGGTGRVHDWAISAQIVKALDCPVILAGGLTPHNAGRAATQAPGTGTAPE